MSMIKNDNTARAFNAGYFLATPEDAEKKTRQLAQSGASTVGVRKIVKAGTIYPANDATAEGFVFEDFDVTNGDIAGSVVLSGTVYEDRLPVAMETAAKNALIAKGFKFIEAAPSVTRPY